MVSCNSISIVVLCIGIAIHELRRWLECMERSNFSDRRVESSILILKYRSQKGTNVMPCINSTGGLRNGKGSSEGISLIKGIRPKNLLLRILNKDQDQAPPGWNLQVSGGVVIT